MTDMKTIQTAYGDVEIETVDCDSCGQTIGKEDARRFGLTSEEQAPNVRINETERCGYACSHCVDEGPISFPPSVDIAIKGHSAEMPLTFILMWPVFMIPTLVTTVFDDNKPAKEFTVGSVAAIIWTTLPLLLLLYFGVL